MKRKNRFFVTVMLAALLTAILLPTAAMAAEGLNDLARVPAGERLPRYIDDIGLLTSEQAAMLTAKLDEISERNQFDTVVAVVPMLDYREARLYAADFFEQNGFGYGSDIDGAILLLAMEDRDFGFASFGYGLNVFTSYGQDYLDTRFLPYLKEDRYYEAFMAYADAVDDFIAKAASGAPYDEGNIPKDPDEVRRYRFIGGAIALALALIIAFAVTGAWRGQLISVRKENLAHVYFREGSMVLTDQRDIFLHRHVQKVRRESSSSGGGGGSFRSSSGRSATGHSGKF
ncbi:MAG: TPM domain-containing protein [Thermoclostridium sp.]|nr:TPM domain-containing protein [Thermoclostridium sp.]